MANKLHSRAMAVASQFGLGSPIGQFILAVAQAVGGGSSGGSGVDFAERAYRQDGDLPVGVGTPTTVFQATPLVVTTTQPNEKVLLTFTADRENASPTGSGQYQFTIDGAPVGFVKESVGDVRETISITDMFTIATPGVHTIDVLVTATTGTETVSDFAILAGVGYLGV